jgi:predicted short-subunit dehydrogenase-like oxidoreductase (DUF2520 family)
LQSIEKIVIIGAGSLATNLAIALNNNGLQIIQIVNRTLSNAELIASKINASFTDNFDEINLNADLYIIAVSDDSIHEILKKLLLKDKFIVHTAGSIDMDVIQTISDNYGVFYPLQTFSKTDIISFENIPVCIEANSFENETLLFHLGHKLSGKVQKITSEQRKILHISAVFSCNFTSYMYLIAQEILTENHLSFDILKPLIQRTAEKVQKKHTDIAISGPARRNDNIVMTDHLEYLRNHPEYKEIYQLISKNIIKHFYNK